MSGNLKHLRWESELAFFINGIGLNKIFRHYIKNILVCVAMIPISKAGIVMIKQPSPARYDKISATRVVLADNTLWK